MTILILAASIIAQAGFSWTAYRIMRNDPNVAEQHQPASDFVLCFFFWWLFLPVFAIVAGNETAKRREIRRAAKASNALRSGQESGLYD